MSDESKNNEDYKKTFFKERDLPKIVLAGLYLLEKRDDLPRRSIEEESILDTLTVALYQSYYILNGVYVNPKESMAGLIYPFGVIKRSVYEEVCRMREKLRAEMKN